MLATEERYFCRFLSSSHVTILIQHITASRLNCNNYREIALFSSAGRALARVVLNYLLPTAEAVLTVSRSSF